MSNALHKNLFIFNIWFNTSFSFIDMTKMCIRGFLIWSKNLIYTLLYVKTFNIHNLYNVFMWTHTLLNIHFYVFKCACALNYTYLYTYTKKKWCRRRSCYSISFHHLYCYGITIFDDFSLLWKLLDLLR